MEQAFRTGASHHFDITLSESRTFEKGSYRVLYARPKKRMARMLGVHREVLVLVTNFPEQQARVLGAALEWIRKSPAGRLEPHHVVVVHSDERGNSKLRDWGRERGMTAIPIFAAKCPADQRQFERMLAEEIFQGDPFDVTGPVANDANFYGRKQEALQMAQRLQGGQILSLLGVRKVGKTSVLNRVVARCIEHHDCEIVMLDCSQDAVWSGNAAGLLAAIREAVVQSRASPRRYTSVARAATTANIASEAVALVAEVLKGSRPLILFVDEADYVTPGSPTARHWKKEFNPLWRNLRAVYQETARQGRPFSIVVSGVSSKWFSVAQIEGVENAALSFVPETYLGPLALSASVAMVRELGARCGLSFDKDAAERISGACACMPFWVRRACSAVHGSFEIDQRPIVLKWDDISATVDSFIATEGAELGRVAVSHLFSVFPELMSVCDTAKTPLASTATLSRFQKVIQKYGLVAMENGQYCMPRIIRSGLDAYQADRQDTPVSSGMLASSSADASSFGEWAEDLAVVGKRRNLMESKFRKVLVGLIRADVLAKKGGANAVADRIRAAVPSDRHRGLPTDPDQIADKLFWLELLQLAEKEWTIVGPLLGDRAEMSHHGKVINERPDAHAKQFDAADFALWRRSLQWFEERLSKL